MKRLVSVLVIVMVGFLLCMSPALAGDLVNGAKVFATNCASCHMGGGNVVNGAKTLKKADLEKNAIASIDAIKTQVMNGKMAMPAFKGRLTAAQIEDVASYVLDKAEKGW